MNPLIYALPALAALILAVAYYRIKHPKGYDINVPAPAVPRTDLLYGYYGCERGQVDAVRDHTNLHWESQFNGMEQATADILMMARATVLDVMPQLFVKVAESGKNYALQANAKAHLVAFLNYLQDRGALQYVVALVPIDEPNINCRSPEDLEAACALLRTVATEYPELAGVKLACIYAAKPEPFIGIKFFDWVGVDDYDMKSSILNGVYQSLVAAKRPDARTILLPGGAFGQDPTPFINWAHADGNVVMVLPFCWFGPREPADKWVGIGSGPLRDQYVAAGRALIGGAQ